MSKVVIQEPPPTPLMPTIAATAKPETIARGSKMPHMTRMGIQRSADFSDGSSSQELLLSVLLIPNMTFRARLVRWLGACLAVLCLAGCQTVTPVSGDANTAASPSKAPAAPSRPPRVGLALGGGAARGFAHIGVIQALEEAGIAVDVLAGTSAGSLVAALYATGRSGRDLVALAQRMDESALTDWSFPGRGVIRGEALARFVRENTGGLPIEQMRRPLGIVATDLASGVGVLFQRGDTGTAVRASSAVPAIFQPVSIAGREYVDGGLVAPVPVRFARQMGAELVIAVDISSAPDGNTTGDSLRLLLQTFAIMSRSINQLELRDADVVIRPDLAGLSGADFTVRQRAIQAGREATVRQLPALRQKIAALSL